MTGEQRPYVGMSAERLGAPSAFITLAYTPPLRNPIDPYATRQAESERTGRLRGQLLAARVDWERTRDILTGNAIAVAVLNLHFPESDGYQISCAECWDFDGYESGSQAAWPCDTYGVMKAGSAP